MTNRRLVSIVGGLLISATALASAPAVSEAAPKDEATQTEYSTLSNAMPPLTRKYVDEYIYLLPGGASSFFYQAKGDLISVKAVYHADGAACGANQAVGVEDRDYHDLGRSRMFQRAPGPTATVLMPFSRGFRVRHYLGAGAWCNGERMTAIKIHVRTYSRKPGGGGGGMIPKVAPERE